MISDLVDFLNCGRWAFDAEALVGYFLQRRVFPAGKTEYGGSLVFGRSGRFYDIFRRPAGREGPQQIARFDQRLDLSAEDLLESIVVADGGKD